jgi:hypothetical protein
MPDVARMRLVFDELLEYGLMTSTALDFLDGREVKQTVDMGSIFVTSFFTDDRRRCATRAFVRIATLIAKLMWGD